jgi:hypothetical protein
MALPAAMGAPGAGAETLPGAAPGVLGVGAGTRGEFTAGAGVLVDLGKTTEGDAPIKLDSGPVLISASSLLGLVRLRTMRGVIDSKISFLLFVLAGL